MIPRRSKLVNVLWTIAEDIALLIVVATAASGILFWLLAAADLLTLKAKP